MVPEEDPARGRDEVAPVGEPLGGGGPPVVEAEHPVGDEAAVKAVGDEVGAHGGQHQPGGADGLAPVEGLASPRRPLRPAARVSPTDRFKGMVEPITPLSLPLFLSARTFELHAIAILRVRPPALVGIRGAGGERGCARGAPAAADRQGLAGEGRHRHRRVPPGWAATSRSSSGGSGVTSHSASSTCRAGTSASRPC